MCGQIAYNDHWLDCLVLRQEYERAKDLPVGTFKNALDQLLVLKKALLKHPLPENTLDALEKHNDAIA